MSYQLNDIYEVCNKLQSQSLIDTNICIADGLNNVGEKVNILICTTHNAVAKTFLSEYLGCDISSCYRISACEIEYKYSPTKNYMLYTDMGLVVVDEQTLFSRIATKQDQPSKVISNQDVLCSESANVSFLYLSQTDSFSYNEWVNNLAQFDYVIYMLDGLQIFNASEKEFSEKLLHPMFSNNRLAYIIGNAGFLDAAEQSEILEYAKAISREGAKIMYYSPENIDSVVKDVSSKSIDLRTQLISDLTSFAKNNLLNELPSIEIALVSQSSDMDNAIEMLSANSDSISTSKDKLSKKIHSYIQDYALIQFEKRLNSFNKSLKSSLSEDINASENIDQDAKWINKYMEHVWNKFMISQEAWLKTSILNEASELETIMNNDIMAIVKQMDVQTQELIKDFILSKYNVHSYLISKNSKTGVGELSKTLKLGSVILAIFSPVAALLTFGGSELIKKVFKSSLDTEKKEHLIPAVESMSDQMKDQVLSQVKTQFGDIAKNLKSQTMAVYDNLIENLTNALVAQKEKQTNAQDTLRYIEEVKSNIN